MTGIQVRQCPRCELRFSYATELEHHLREDHPAPATVADAPEVDPAPAAEEQVDRRSPASAVLFAAAAVLFVAMTIATQHPVTAAVTTAVVVFLAAWWVRRARARRPKAGP